MTGIHLDAVGGISGDMFVAAMVDARPELRRRVLQDAVSVLPKGTGSPAFVEVMSGGLRALRFGLSGAPAKEPARSHVHGRDEPQEDAGAGSFAAMGERIRAARLAGGSAEHALAILTVLAEAEATIHRVPVADVHFHEIADWDSLLDVVAAGSIAAALEGARWTVSPLPRGSGLVETRHGLLPVPTPATAAILTDFEWRDDGIAGERVTPTGAAILRHLATGSRAGAAGRLQAVGTGAGTRILPGVPNVLRALVFEAVDRAGEDRVVVLSFEIDDMSGEEISVAADRLRAMAGVLDLSIGQRSGKKGRPMHSFRLLIDPEKTEAASERCFLETSTIGLRIREERRVVLPRTLSRVTDEEGAVGVKTVQRPGLGRTAKAESDDLAGNTLQARRRLKERAERGVSQ